MDRKEPSVESLWCCTLLLFAGHKEGKEMSGQLPTALLALHNLTRTRESSAPAEGELSKETRGQTNALNLSIGLVEH